MIAESATRRTAPVLLPTRIGDRLRHRRQLAEQDRSSAQLAELHHIRALLSSAADVVDRGWIQRSWFAYADERGQQRPVTAVNLHDLVDRPVTGACVVGAVVHAAGGRPSAGSQLVQRTFDLMWHALYRDVEEPVAFCPAPPVRAAHVRDLTSWNDRPGRTRAEVAGLLHRADHAASRCIGQLRPDC